MTTPHNVLKPYTNKKKHFIKIKHKKLRRHVSLSISVHLKMYVLIAIGIQSEFSNTDVQSMILPTALLYECLTKLLDYG